ncbi:MAG: hypothetical protein HN348_33875, partial [Proteobacteria bacterium]|nr:hypothetical protein [Pseudomonadota bacterium]
MILSLMIAAAMALDDPPELPPSEFHPSDFLEVVEDGIVINWTKMTLEVTDSARGSRTESKQEAVEQLARRRVGQGILAGAANVAVTTDKTLADLQEEAELADPLRSRLDRWVAAESRYYASGRVELVGVLFLQELLKPYTMNRARQAPENPREPRYTGLVLDARGTHGRPAFAPRLLGDDSTVLYDGTLWLDEALTRTPAIYVIDPAHRAAVMAGDSPMFIGAERADGGDFHLTAKDTLRFRTAMSQARLLGEG